MSGDFTIDDDIGAELDEWVVDSINDAVRDMAERAQERAKTQAPVRPPKAPDYNPDAWIKGDSVDLMEWR